jgi:aldehyde dehydrogenase (NAD+)
VSVANETRAPLQNADRFFIGGEWVQPSSDAMIDVIDSGTEQLFFSVAEAQAADISRAVAAARQAFDEGPSTGRRPGTGTPRSKGLSPVAAAAARR